MANRGWISHEQRDSLLEQLANKEPVSTYRLVGLNGVGIRPASGYDARYEAQAVQPKLRCAARHIILREWLTERESSPHKLAARLNPHSPPSTRSWPVRLRYCRDGPPAAPHDKYEASFWTATDRIHQSRKPTTVRRLR